MKIGMQKFNYMYETDIITRSDIITDSQHNLIKNRWGRVLSKGFELFHKQQAIPILFKNYNGTKRTLLCTSIHSNIHILNKYNRLEKFK